MLLALRINRQVNRYGCLLFALGITMPAYAGVAWQTLATGPNATADFETTTNWAVPTYSPIPSLGPELSPPGADSTWFIEGAADNTNTPEFDPRGNFNGVITLNSARDGSDAMHPKIGAGSIGGGISNEITTLVLNANVTFTGAERNSAGELNTTVRQVRVGQSDYIDDNVFPWGIVKQTHGQALFEMAADTSRSDLLITGDKTLAAGGIWEIGGDASFHLFSDMQLGAKAGVKAPGGIFRVRGSNAGPIIIGDRFQVRSQTATWDVTEVDLGGGVRQQFNRGKSTVEFVLDANGVSPITVEDNLDLGSNATISTPMLGEVNAVMPAFLRVKLSQPTDKGMGTYDPLNPGAGDVIVLFNADRITSGVTSVPAGAEELLQGRFFEPDHTNDAGTSPHRALLDGFRINSDYAGQVYSWQVNYFEGSGGSQDGVIDPAVILSGLQITGTKGDLNGDSMLNEADRTALMNAIASPPKSHYELLNAKQNIFDLNADDIIDNLDLVTFNTYFLAPVGLPGDFNNNGKVDAADYTIWRNNLGQPEGNLLNGNGNGGTIDQTDYALWKSNFGMGSGAGALGAGAVPEPSTVLMCFVSVLGLVGVRRRAA